MSYLDGLEFNKISKPMRKPFIRATVNGAGAYDVTMSTGAMELLRKILPDFSDTEVLAASDRIFCIKPVALRDKPPGLRVKNSALRGKIDLPLNVRLYLTEYNGTLVCDLDKQESKDAT
tara:strand:- start:965 stop:1321 length:357 start_codon:yes stop_codon:yes gene_type:complete